MAGIKKIKNQKIVTNQGTSETKEYPIFCFKHLTKNSQYNFKCFTNERERRDAKSIVLDNTFKFQTMTWLELMKLPKGQGFETLHMKALNFSPTDYIVTEDTKVFVFRVSGKWRMIGVKRNEFKGVIHILGFDFNYSAYNHGS